MAEQDSEWSEYYQATGGRPPRPILVAALKHVADRGVALDLGAGPLNESRWLLAQGFRVTAVDQDPASAQIARTIHDPRFQFVSAAYDQFQFPAESYSLIAALFALPFNPPRTFDRVWHDLVGSLKPGGIFCGQLFGPHDSWNGTRANMTFHDRRGVETLLDEQNVLELDEEEKDGPTATGGQKHWHIWHIIFRRP